MRQGRDGSAGNAPGTPHLGAVCSAANPKRVGRHRSQVPHSVRGAGAGVRLCELHIGVIRVCGFNLPANVLQPELTQIQGTLFLDLKLRSVGG